MTYDYIVKTLAFDGEIRAYTALTTETIWKTQTRHYTWSTASAVMGKTMMTTAMMGAMLKGDQRLAVTVDDQGPVGRITADANAKGEVRAYVNRPQTHFPLGEQDKLDVRRAVETNGSIMVIRDVGMGDYFSEASPIISGGLGGDFTYYYAASEQTPSSVGLGVLVSPDNTIKAARGFIIQVIPDTKDEVISKLEEAISEVTPIFKLIERGLTPEGLLNEILGEDHVQILEKMSTQSECNCSHEKFLNAIRGLGEAETQSVVKEDHGAEAVCRFCENKYKYTEEELDVLLESLA